MVIYLGMRVYSLRGLRTLLGDMGPAPVGLMRALPTRPARGGMFSARGRLGLEGEAPLPPAVAEGA